MEENEYKALLEWEAWLKDAAQRVKEGEDVRSVAEEAVGVTKQTRIDLVKGTRVEEGREGILDYLIAEINRRVREGWGDERHYGVDEAYYDFGVFPHIGYLDDNDVFWAYAALALTIPPRETTEWIFENCLMIPIAGGHAVPPGDSKGRYLLLFEASTIHSELNHRVIHLILHEAAHAYLRHEEPGPISRDLGEEEERQANRLVAQWMRAVQYNKDWPAKKLSRGA